MNDLDWIIEAKKHIGVKEVKNTNTSKEIEEWQEYLLNTPVKKGHWLYGVAWCGTFVAYCLKKNNITIPKHWYRALDYVNAGAKLTKPCYGCVAVKTRNGGGHVCFVVGKNKDGKLVCLGGNQGNSVCYATYDASVFQEFRWYGETNTPLQSRYDLPLVDVKSGAIVKES